MQLPEARASEENKSSKNSAHKSVTALDSFRVSKSSRSEKEIYLEGETFMRQKSGEMSSYYLELIGQDVFVYK